MSHALPAPARAGGRGTADSRTGRSSSGTVRDPVKAVREYPRVVAAGGRVIYTFCSLPQGWVSHAGTALLRAAVRRGFAGEFLPPERIPWHDCDVSHRTRFAGGLTTEISLGKCCAVGEPVVPNVAPAA